MILPIRKYSDSHGKHDTLPRNNPPSPIQSPGRVGHEERLPIHQLPVENSLLSDKRDGHFSFQKKNIFYSSDHNTQHQINENNKNSKKKLFSPKLTTKTVDSAKNKISSSKNTKNSQNGFSQPVKSYNLRSQNVFSSQRKSGEYSKSFASK